jgi:hypothetical protein
VTPAYREIGNRIEGFSYALDGGLWLHRWKLPDGRPMAHLVSSDKSALLAWGAANGMDARWIQHHPLKDPRTGKRVEAWHWDLLGSRLPPRVSGDREP